MQIHPSSALAEPFCQLSQQLRTTTPERKMNADIERTAARLKKIVDSKGNEAVSPGAQHFERAWPNMLAVAQQRMTWFPIRCAKEDAADIARVFQARGFMVNPTTHGDDGMQLMIRWH
jgi:hypothetical protein